MIGTLEFEPISHRYLYNGRLVPSVTQVLQDARLVDFSSVPKDVLEKAAARGTDAHRKIEALGKYPPIRPPLKKAPVEVSWREQAREFVRRRITGDGYVEAAKKFYRDSGFVPNRVEFRACHPIHQYAGTVDVASKRGGELAIIDWKTGDVVPGYAIQLAAYANFFKDPCAYRRIDVKLNINGTYRAHEFPMSETHRDFQVFLAALACYRWRLRNGMIEARKNEIED